ncbi:MAG TPA: multiheme c-type cytochrome [Gemmataceae bacterium]|nr:multiheme c-type cytochrome [Gemmataceae bacterium]
MSFRSVFIALVIGFGLVLAGFLINRQRPGVETDQPSAAYVRATGKCAECHSQQQHSIVHEYELSAHAREGITCLDCHQPTEGQKKLDHHGFVISKGLTAANCRSCHEMQYQQFLRSRHGAPSWAAVYGEKGLPAEQVAFSEKYHPGACKRPANPLVRLEGEAAVTTGCVKCHSVGRPNDDGTIGSCTACHTRHTASVAIARLPTTCGQCHMGPDHSQLEIYNESKHGVMFAAQRNLLRLDRAPGKLTTRDMFIPTCATCHMSGLNGLKATHDTSERLSWLLAAEVSTKRPGYAQAQASMKEVCSQCHTPPLVERVYDEAEKAVESTNRKVKAASDIVAGLRKDGVLSSTPFAQPIDFRYFDLWHYYGRTAKHGAFMGGQDFAQWHGNYPILAHTVEIQALAKEMRRAHAKDK